MGLAGRGQWGADAWLCGALVGLALALRMPFAGVVTLDWDEHTFLLMGQEVVRGHLPYAPYFDIKAPLLFWAFGAVELVAGKHLAWFRLAGCLGVAAGAICVFLGLREAAGRWSAFFGGCSVVLASVASVSCLAVMSEVVALPILCAHVIRVLIPGGERRGAANIRAGFLGACCALIRPNLALVVLGSLAIVVVGGRDRGARLGGALRFVGGGLVPCAFVFLLYVLSGEVEALYRCVWLAPLAYREGGEAGIGAAAGGLLSSPGMVGGVCGIAVCATFLVRGNPSVRRAVWCTTGLGALAFGSIVATGEAFRHYALQMAPFVGVWLAGAMAALETVGPGPRKRAIQGALVGLALLPLRPWGEAVRDHLMPRVVASDECAILSRVIAERGSRRALLFVGHGALWLQGLPPPSPWLVHPTNVLRERLLNVASGRSWHDVDYLREAFSFGPDVVVPGGFLEDPRVSEEGRRFFREELEADYEKEVIRGLGDVWLRKGAG